MAVAAFQYRTKNSFFIPIALSLSILRHFVTVGARLKHAFNEHSRDGNARRHHGDVPVARERCFGILLVANTLKKRIVAMLPFMIFFITILVVGLSPSSSSGYSGNGSDGEVSDVCHNVSNPVYCGRGGANSWQVVLHINDALCAGASG